MTSDVVNDLFFLPRPSEPSPIWVVHAKPRRRMNGKIGCVIEQDIAVSVGQNVEHAVNVSELRNALPADPQVVLSRPKSS